ncbi:MAG TPA: 4-alpha-glucanotransferase, partial [Paludibacter sp.]|nr:4-alpha-glucanotransferase [Paludibacter sp.]
MKIQFNIHYKTQWGQSMYLLIYKSSEQSGNIPAEGFVMQCNDKAEWNIEITIDTVASLSYQYAILNANKSFDYEYGGVRNVQFEIVKESVSIYDNWRASYGDSPFATAAFSDCFFKRSKPKVINQDSNGNLVLRINCPQMEPNRHFAVVGNQEALGNWDVAHKVRLDESQFPVWSIALDVDKITFPLEYKYLIVDTESDEVLAWGGGPNRLVPAANKQALTVVTDEHFIRTIPSWKGTGVAIPVFSLRSEEGFGIGEFNDLKKMVDWAKKTGQRVIQTLPIN